MLIMQKGLFRFDLIWLRLDNISNWGTDSFETFLFQITEDLYSKCMDVFGVISLMDKARLEFL